MAESGPNSHTKLQVAWDRCQFHVSVPDTMCIGTVLSFRDQINYAASVGLAPIKKNLVNS
jgi:hypothetical protein